MPRPISCTRQGHGAMAMHGSLQLHASMPSKIFKSTLAKTV